MKDLNITPYKVRKQKYKIKGVFKMSITQKEVLNVINSNPSLCHDAFNNLFRNKTFVVVSNNGHVERFSKTKRGAESYIKKQQSISYYDDYSQSMVTCGGNLSVFEIHEADLLNPSSSKKLWYKYFRSIQGQDYLYNQALTQAKYYNCEGDLLEYITFTIDEMRNEKGLLVIDQYEDNYVPVEEVQEITITESNHNSETVETPALEEVAAVEQSDVTYKTGTGTKGNGIEIYFTSKPSEEVRNMLKANGFKWSRNNGCWWTVETPSRLEFAKQLAGNQEETSTNENSTITDETNTSQPISYPSIDIEDIETYVIDQQLQEREHDANWIFRRNKQDHTKTIQEHFSHYNSQVVELLETTDNSYYIYKLKETLQRFKKKYHQAYINWLSAKASQPHWAVSGRGNVNKGRYDKNVNRQDKWMFELVELDDNMKKTLQSYKLKIKKDQHEQIKRQVQSTDNTLTFTTETREYTFMNVTEKKRVHVYENYFITKTWGCFRIFLDGQEIHSMKTTEKLDHAKQFVAYHVNQQEQKAV
jgi:hypothetical protein